MFGSNNNRNGLDSANKFLKKMFAWIMSGVLVIAILIGAVLMPIGWIGNVVGNLWEDVTNIFSGSSQTDTERFKTDLDIYQYNGIISVAHDEILGCSMDNNYIENMKGCFEIIKDDGHIDEDKLAASSSADAFRTYMDDEIEEYYGKLNFRHNIYIIPSFYRLGYEVEGEDDEVDIVWDQELKNGGQYLPEGICNNPLLVGNADACRVEFEGKIVNNSNAPTTSGLSKNYGFQISEEDMIPTFNHYQELNASDVYAMAEGHITSLSSSKIVIDAVVESVPFTITYEGNFNRFMYPNANRGLPIDPTLAWPTDLIATTSEPFKVYVQYEGKYINPAIFYNVENGWNIEGISGSGMGGTTGDGGYTDVTDTPSGHRAYITNQVAFDPDLWSGVSFKLPFDKIVISQCPEVIGVGDGGNMHTALDYYNANARGKQPVTSAISGIVVESGYHSISGNFITVEDENTGVRVNYNHLEFNNEITRLSVGDRVTQSTYVGLMGESGTAFGVHIHMNVYQPTNAEKTEYGWINPMHLLSPSEYTYMNGVSACKVSK